MSTVRARDVVIFLECLANADSDRLFAAVQMGETRHQRARIELIHLLLKHADAHHLPIGVHPEVLAERGYRSLGDDSHSPTPVWMPDMFARTSKRTAKSSLAQFMPRAAVRNSFATAVVGRGTFN